MTEFNLIMSICTLIGTLSTILFAYLAFRRSEKEEETKDVQLETTILKDISYIKEGIERVEKNLNKLEEKYSNMNERIVKVELGLKNLKKEIDGLESRGY